MKRGGNSKKFSQILGVGIRRGCSCDEADAGLRIVARVDLAKIVFRSISNYCLCMVGTMGPANHRHHVGGEKSEDTRDKD